MHTHKFTDMDACTFVHVRARACVRACVLADPCIKIKIKKIWNQLI